MIPKTENDIDSSSDGNGNDDGIGEVYATNNMEGKYHSSKENSE